MSESFYDYSVDELKTCLRETARLWKRKITPLDVSICEDLFLEYGFDSDLILYLLGFVKNRGADTLKYLYPIADVLKKKGIHDRTGAELTLEKSFQKYMDILVYINWTKRVPTSAEKEKIDEILLTYSPTQEEIREVGEITRKAKRPSLQYFETVLRNKRDTASSVKVQDDRCYAVIELPLDFEQIKQTVKKEAELSEVAYNTWIKDLKVTGNTDKSIEICVPGQDDRFLHFIEKKYKGYFESACLKKGVHKEIMLRMGS